MLRPLAPDGPRALVRYWRSLALTLALSLASGTQLFAAPMNGESAIEDPVRAEPLSEEPAQESPRQVLSQIGITPKLNAQVPLDVSLVDHRGQRMQLGDVLGQRPTVLCLVYFRCPMLCNLTADGLVRTVVEMPESVGRDFDVLMVSFDPLDGPEGAAAARQTALQRYDRPRAEQGWDAMTGETPAIAALTRSVGFHYRWDPELKQYAHAAGLIVLTPEGRVSSYLDGVQFSPAELSSAIRRAAAGKIASSEPQSFMRCYLYDPTTGRFGAAVQWTVRALGALTVLGLAIGVAAMILRERRAAVLSQGAE